MRLTSYRDGRCRTANRRSRSSPVGFLYSGWCQAALPHKKLSNDQVWKIETERVALVVEPGRRNIPGGATEWVGVPYGSRARLILRWDEVRIGDNGVFDVFLLDSQYGWALVGSFEPRPIGLASPFS